MTIKTEYQISQMSLFFIFFNCEKNLFRLESFIQSECEESWIFPEVSFR